MILMLAGQRQMLILEEVRARGSVRVGELTKMLEVSDMTVRRDLDALAEQGLVVKVHGGATALPNPQTDDPGLETRLHRRLREKRAIAESARALVRPGQVIGLSAGTTTLRLAQALADVPSITVVTNSVEIASALRRDVRLDITVVLTGGVVVSRDTLVGPLAAAAASSIHLDVLFLGVHGMAEDAGFTSPDLLETEIDRTFIASADKVVVVADHTKWGVRGLSRVADLEEADVLVTDSGLAAPARRVLEQKVGRLVLAPVERARRHGTARGARSA
jgi:DeoR/GlpR family transcriptional regulator of sugar metabolism